MSAESVPTSVPRYKKYQMNVEQLRSHQTDQESFASSAIDFDRPPFHPLPQACLPPPPLALKNILLRSSPPTSPQSKSSQQNFLHSPLTMPPLVLGNNNNSNTNNNNNPLSQLADISLATSQLLQHASLQKGNGYLMESQDLLAQLLWPELVRQQMDLTAKALLDLRNQQQRPPPPLTPSISPSPPPAHNSPAKAGSANTFTSVAAEPASPQAPPPAHQSPEKSARLLLPEAAVTIEMPPEQSVPEDLRVVARKLEFGQTISSSPAQEEDSDSIESSVDGGRSSLSDGRRCGKEGFFPCPDCGKAYSTSSNLARHRQTHRSLEDKKARNCPHCDKTYVSMPAYSMHLRTHNQGCKCPFCGKCFSRPWLLQGHIRTHTGEKPFRCPICDKSFADKSNLRAHVQTHSSDKPFTCRRCGKAFALKSYLYKHEESSCMRAFREGLKQERRRGGGNRRLLAGALMQQPQAA